MQPKADKTALRMDEKECIVRKHEKSKAFLLLEERKASKEVGHEGAQRFQRGIRLLRPQCGHLVGVHGVLYLEFFQNSVYTQKIHLVSVLKHKLRNGAWNKTGLATCSRSLDITIRPFNAFRRSERELRTTPIRVLYRSSS